MAVGVDVDVVDPHLSRFDAGEAVAQVDVAFANRLHLGPEQRDPGLEGFEDVVVVERLPVLGDVLLRLFAFGFHRTQCVMLVRPTCSVFATRRPGYDVWTEIP